MKAAESDAGRRKEVRIQRDPEWALLRDLLGDVLREQR